MNRRLLVATLACWSLTATLWAQPPDERAPNARAPETGSAATAPDPRSVAFLIGPEDILDIQVWRNAELSRTVPVRPDGNVSLPLVNDIQAAGLTPTQLREQLTTKLSEYVPSPEVSVIVREVHSVKVSLVGAVKIPGRHEVKSPATVLELIAQAQGLTEFAMRDHIVVIRRNGGTTTRVPFNYRKAVEGSERDNFFVRAGDIIFVP